MRTSFDCPDPIMKHLKLLSLERNISLRALLLDLIEKGLASEHASATPAPKKAGKPFIAPPILRGAHPMQLNAKQLSNAGLFELLDKA